MLNFTHTHVRRAASFLFSFCIVALGCALQTGQTSSAPAVSSQAGNSITVTSTSDVANDTDGLCTLREAITAANTDTASGVTAGECGAGSNSGADTINLTTLSGTFTLTSALPNIASPMTFNGPGQSQLTVSGNNSFRVFNITASNGFVKFSGLTIANGRAEGDWGGGILNQNDAQVEIDNSTITNNIAMIGGGITNRGISDFTITNTTISTNLADLGGGCYNAIGTLRIYGSTLNNNNTRQIINGNGGAILNGGLMYVINSTLDRNMAWGVGGGIYVLSGSAYIANSTISQNVSAGGGGGINNGSGVVRLINSIIAVNGAQAGPDLLGPFISLGHNLVTNINFSSGFTLGTNNANGDLVGASFAPLFPFALGPLQNNGGLTKTRALLPGSLGIDGGDNCAVQSSGCPDGLSLALTTDQRGVLRQVNQAVDIGAFESRSFLMSATSGTPQIKEVNNLFDPLIVTVSSPSGDPVEGGEVVFTAPASGPSANIGGSTSASKQIEGNGQSSFRPTANEVGGGPYQVVASIRGSNLTAAFSLTNLKGTTTTTVASSANPSDLTQSVTFSATVSTFGDPTGSVQFKIDGINAGTPVTLSPGGPLHTAVAQFTTSALTVGTHSVTVDYSGDASFSASSGALSGGQVVRPLPTLSINDVSILEGDTGTRTLMFEVGLSAASNLNVSVNYATSNNTASSTSDYQATSGSTSVSPGLKFTNVFVTVNGDIDIEPDETFTVTLSTPVNATLNRSQGTGTIQNDDIEGGFLRFSHSNYIVNESGGQVTITVIRTSNTSRAVTVDYSTNDIGSPVGCDQINGKASAKCDFTSAKGTLRFAAGETSKTFNVLVNRDSYADGLETLGVTLSSPTNGSGLLTPSSATVSIIDSATGPPSNLIDDATVFVRQHYHDFLNREPDSSGLSFWVNQITSCGSDQTCVELKRINVSAAFFLSIEFQQTGYFIERLYKASYGDANGQSTIGGSHGFPVPVIRLNEFLPDTQEIGRGVVVGLPGWENLLQNNKQVFAADFVQRTRFTSNYPTSLSPSQFVDLLFGNAGVEPSAEDRNAAIDEFGSSTTTTDVGARGRALKRVVENKSFEQQELNRAFVLMQYFGYMRRNPDDPQDTDYSGYDFWLSKLNNFNGNFINAEMVKAFISSAEYRKRFGQ